MSNTRQPGYYWVKNKFNYDGPNPYSFKPVKWVSEDGGYWDCDGIQKTDCYWGEINETRIVEPGE